MEDGDGDWIVAAADLHSGSDEEKPTARVSFSLSMALMKCVAAFLLWPETTRVGV